MVTTNKYPYWLYEPSTVSINPPIGLNDSRGRKNTLVTTPVKSSCCLVSSWGGVLATSKTGGSEGRLLGRSELPWLRVWPKRGRFPIIEVKKFQFQHYLRLKPICYQDVPVYHTVLKSKMYNCHTVSELHSKSKDFNSLFMRTFPRTCIKSTNTKAIKSERQVYFQRHPFIHFAIAFSTRVFCMGD